MAVARKAPLKPGEFDLEEDDDRDRVDVFKKGEIGRVLRTPLLELAAHYREGPAREHIENFVKWLPEVNMEQFLMLCLEYGAQKTMPKSNGRKAKPTRV